ncbi:hypothetical protein EON78_06245 [bacterium]|nr:MAG: hypothetical protein EON78_06245 [bacterium]
MPDTRKNITKSKSTITSSDKKFSVSTNSVIVANGAALTYSGGSGIDLTIDLALNTLPVTISPENGSPTPTKSITVEELGND